MRRTRQGVPDVAGASCIQALRAADAAATQIPAMAVEGDISELFEGRSGLFPSGKQLYSNTSSLKLRAGSGYELGKCQQGAVECMFAVAARTVAGTASSIVTLGSASACAV
eukprot:jgi/Tetstr1/436997/TSEL_002736.t1